MKFAEARQGRVVFYGDRRQTECIGYREIADDYFQTKPTPVFRPLVDYRDCPAFRVGGVARGLATFGDSACGGIGVDGDACGDF